MMDRDDGDDDDDDGDDRDDDDDGDGGVDVNDRDDDDGWYEPTVDVCQAGGEVEVGGAHVVELLLGLLGRGLLSRDLLERSLLGRCLLVVGLVGHFGELAKLRPFTSMVQT